MYACCRCVQRMWNCVYLKHLQMGFHSRIPVWPHRPRAHTKLREKETYSDSRLEEALALTLI